MVNLVVNHGERTTVYRGTVRPTMVNCGSSTMVNYGIFL